MGFVINELCDVCFRNSGKHDKYVLAFLVDNCGNYVRWTLAQCKRFVLLHHFTFLCITLVIS